VAIDRRPSGTECSQNQSPLCFLSYFSCAHPEDRCNKTACTYEESSAINSGRDVKSWVEEDEAWMCEGWGWGGETCKKSGFIRKLMKTRLTQHVEGLFPHESHSGLRRTERDGEVNRFNSCSPRLWALGSDMPN
jgi:hypothetical protein